jgi:hypothetical protein
MRQGASSGLPMTLLTGLSGFFRTTSQRGMAPLAEGFWRSQEPFAALLPPDIATNRGLPRIRQES